MWVNAADKGVMLFLQQYRGLEQILSRTEIDVKRLFGADIKVFMEHRVYAEDEALGDLILWIRCLGMNIEDGVDRLDELVDRWGDGLEAASEDRCNFNIQFP